MVNFTKEENQRRETLILEAYTTTPNFFKIAEVTGLDYDFVRVRAKKLGLKNVRVSTIIWIDENTVECSKCHEHIPYEALGVIRPNGPARSTLSYCRKCRTNQIIKNNKSSLDSYLQNRIRSIKTRAKTNQLAFELDVEYLKQLYETQNGKCFYTDEKLELPIEEIKNTKNRHTMSVDKLIPELGYTKGNVVLCTVRANFIKGDLSLTEIKEWLPSWYQRITTLLNKDV
jgi:hypothetical protein